jgi:hypothetical protein
MSKLGFESDLYDLANSLCRHYKKFPYTSSQIRENASRLTHYDDRLKRHVSDRK